MLALLVVALPLAGQPASGGTPSWRAWLCFPGRGKDWCRLGLTTTVYLPNKTHEVVDVPVPSRPPIDCFYVYPSVTQQQASNTDLRLQSDDADAAVIQAAGFSQACRVFAPLYFQGNSQLAYADVLAAWRDYMAHDNGGRGVVLIGHSEGAFVLERLIEQEIEPSSRERRLLVSALLLGGDVVVADGSTEGGTFARVPACTSATETGCVVAYSSWDRTPPPGAHLLGVTGTSQHVLCVNPAAPGSTRAEPIDPVFPGFDPEGIAPASSRYAASPWVEFPDLYTARCVRQGDRAWLLVTRLHIPGDDRPTVQEILGPDHGLHAADINIALANLVGLVLSESRAWLAHR